MAAAGLGSYCALLSLVACVFIVQGQQVLVAHKPDYVRLRGDALPLRVTEVQDVLGLMLGLHTAQDVKWNGLFSGNAFQRPRAAVLLVAEGAAGQSPTLRSHATYAIDADDVVVSTSKLESRLQALYGKNALTVELSQQYKLSDVQDAHSPLFDDVPSGKHAIVHSLRTDPESVVSDSLHTGSLNVSDPDYYHTVAELETARHLLKRAGQRQSAAIADGTAAAPHADLFTIYLDGFLKVATARGFESAEARSSWQLTDDGLRKVVDAARKAYDDDAVVLLLTMKPVALTAEERALRSRQARSLLTVADSLSYQNWTNGTINLAASYSSDYNATFNIILWFCIIFFLVVVYVAFGIWHMDPGRESIIYRMTMQRTKKDN